MRTIVILVTGMILTVLSMGVCGCTEKYGKVSVIGADGKEYYSYQDACRNQDFDAAHRFLDEMKNKKAQKDFDYSEANEEVFRLEALYLASHNDEQMNKRILYLLNEDETNERTFKKRCKMLIDIAKSTNNNGLFISVLKMVPDAIGDVVEDYLPLLVGLQDKDLSNIVINYMLEKKKKMSSVGGYLPTPEGTIMKEEKHIWDKEYNCEVANNRDYHEIAIRTATEYNELCDNLLKNAIDEKNSFLAWKIVDLYMSVPCAWHEGRRVYYSNQSKTNARKLIINANLQIESLVSC